MNSPGSGVVQTPYLLSDIMLSFMVFRLYFLLQAALVLSPIEKLNSRRICFQKGFEINMWFQIRSNLLSYPLVAMSVLIALSVMFFSLSVMIYERPYF
jgi:hypothetical protein